MGNISFLLETFGSPAIMFVTITILGIILKVKVSKSIESGALIGGALVLMIQGVTLLINTLNSSLTNVAENMKIFNLSTIDVGWAPVSAITWGSVYTIYFIGIVIIVNMIMLKYNKTNTLDVDIFNMWHVSLIGLLVMYYSYNIILATFFVILVSVLKIINSDILKPTFNDVAKMPEMSPTTSTHIVFMINPIVMILDKIVSKIFPFLDKYDFDASKLNKKIGFFGGKFAIGIYIGLFISIIGGKGIKDAIFTALLIGMVLEMFSFAGSFLTKGIDPISQGITNILSKKLTGRKFNIGIDWPFLASRAEMWAVANILAPILFVFAIIIPTNDVLPLGGIMALGLTPALLVITRGKIIRMLVIGIFMLPIYLLSATAIAPFITKTTEILNGTKLDAMITHTTLDGPIEKFIAILIGKSGDNPSFSSISYAVLAVAIYILIFIWYKKEMEKRNALYKANTEEA